MGGINGRMIMGGGLMGAAAILLVMGGMMIIRGGASEGETIGVWQAGEPQLRPTFGGSESAGSVQSTSVPEIPINRCVNLGNALEAPEEGLWGYSIRDEDIVRIAEAGFDTIRVPIRWSAHAGKRAPYTIDPAFFARVDHVVTLARAHGLNVIINVHHYEEIMSHPRAHTPRLLGLWEQIAAHYADMDDGVIFEVLNEPQGKMTNALMEPVNKRALEIIRHENPTRWVMLSGDQWGGFAGLKGARLPDDSRTIWSFHFYQPFDFTHQGAPWTGLDLPTGVRWGGQKDREKVTRYAAEAAAYGRRHGKPLFLGEFGAYTEAPAQDRVAWVRHVRQAAEANGIAWCHWDFASAFPIYDRDREEWMSPMKDALLDESPHPN